MNFSLPHFIFVQAQQEKAAAAREKMGNFTLNKISSHIVQEGELVEGWCNLRRMEFIANFVGTESNWNLHAGIWKLFIWTHCVLNLLLFFCVSINECASLQSCLFLTTPLSSTFFPLSATLAHVFRIQMTNNLFFHLKVFTLFTTSNFIIFCFQLELVIIFN